MFTIVAVWLALVLASCSSGSPDATDQNLGSQWDVPTVTASAAVEGESTLACTVADDRLTEISGLAASIQHSGILWTHNDSGGGARVYALDAQTCDVQATITMDGIDVIDTEAIAVGQDSNGRPVVWVADIGGNTVRRSNVWLHSFVEPAQIQDQRVQVRSSSIRYSDAPGDSESLLVEPKPDGRMWIVSKRQTSQGKFYALPNGFGPGTRSATARPVGEAPWLATDAAFSPSADQFVIRTYLGARIYQGLPPGEEERGVTVPSEGQGEAITFSADGGALYTLSEGTNADLWRTAVR